MCLINVNTADHYTPQGTKWVIASIAGLLQEVIDMDSVSVNHVWCVTRKNWYYDEYDSFVVVAPTETAARNCILQDIYHGAVESEMFSEGLDFIDQNKSTCVKVDVAGGPTVVLGSFNAG